jgi:O-Antigen ligase
MDALLLKRLLTIAIALVLAIGVGSGVADGSFFWPSIALLACGMIFLAWAQWPVSAMLMAAVLFGYIVGNRGFAQLYVANSLPLLPAELGLTVCGTILIAQSALRRELPIRRDALNLVILVWLVLGAGRLGLDFRSYGLVAVRDSAMVYYALFFFIGQSLGSEASGRRWLFGGLTAALAILPLSFLAFTAFSDWFFTHLMVRNVPLVIYKADIAATCLGAGVFLFFHFAHQGHRWAWLGVLGSFGSAVFSLTRAALIGIMLATGLHVAARRWRMIAMLGLSALLLGLVSTVWTLARGRPITESRAFQVVEYATTTLNLSGTGNLSSQVSEQDVKGNPIDNNQFRLVWWQTVIDETMRTNPLLGLGFGHDLAAQFLIQYGLMGDTDFNTRSPHNFAVSTFARMGFVGLAALLAILVVMLSGTWHAVKSWQRETAASEAPALWAMCWVIFVSACFGVVLEGPMGAVVFWTILGLAHTATNPTEETADAAAAALQPAESAGEVALSP